VTPGGGSEWLLADFRLASQPGNERTAMQRVVTAVEGLGLAAARLERLKTAVSEATLNAMEHGNHFQAGLEVGIRVVASQAEVLVTVVDQGGALPVPPATAPDLDAKLAGLQSPRGWGRFLMQQMVDEVIDETDGQEHRVQLRLRLG
jgi:anti-sigma regulatory factor (Ser/Thr protein kinase)